MQTAHQFPVQLCLTCLIYLVSVFISMTIFYISKSSSTLKICLVILIASFFLFNSLSDVFRYMYVIDLSIIVFIVGNSKVLPAENSLHPYPLKHYLLGIESPGLYK